MRSAELLPATVARRNRSNSTSKTHAEYRSCLKPHREAAGAGVVGATGSGARFGTIMHVHNGSAPRRQPARNCRLINPSSRIVAGAIAPPAGHRPRLVPGDDVRIGGNCPGLEVISAAGSGPLDRRPTGRPQTSLQPSSAAKGLREIHPAPSPPVTSLKSSRAVVARSGQGSAAGDGLAICKALRTVAFVAEDGAIVGGWLLINLTRTYSALICSASQPYCNVCSFTSTSVASGVIFFVHSPCSDWTRSQTSRLGTFCSRNRP